MSSQVEPSAAGRHFCDPEKGVSQDRRGCVRRNRRVIPDDGFSEAKSLAV
ncbi:MAG: hypothetical protein RID07_08415 [Lacipirellulaceae bacterium]